MHKRIIKLLLHEKIMNEGRSKIFYFGAEKKENKKKVIIISYTPVFSEPRVIRQAQALLGDGWDVFVVGHDSAVKPPKNWNFICLPDKAPFRIRLRIILKLFRACGIFLAMHGFSDVVKQIGARIYHKSIPIYLWKYVSVKKFFKEKLSVKPDLIISHDYFTADIGLYLARKYNSRFVIDCHEYARGQYMHDIEWVKTIRPYVSAWQDYYLKQADLVTTVCDGIGNLLNKEQELKRPVKVVRSVPFTKDIEFKSVEENKIKIVYLGDISYIRGIHKAIKSMPRWRKEFHLILQGNVSDEYRDDLMRLANILGVDDRLHYRMPVPFIEIVDSISDADIGYFVHKNISPQKKYVLPNKFFEYISAGLALCVSNLPEMSKIVNHYENGLLVDDYCINSIANTINKFTKKDIEKMKRKSLLAAQELNWDVEKEIMLNAYKEIF